MKRLAHLALIVGALAVASLAQAQTFTVTPSSGSGPKTASWDVPGGTNCQAGGDWTGAKAASGTEQLAGLAVGTHTFTLTCTVPGPLDKADLVLSWIPATQNVDGTPYTNAKGYQIFTGKTSPPSTMTVLSDPALKTYTLKDIGAGTWFAAIKSVNTQDVTSDLSGIVSKALVDTPTTVPWTGTQTADVTVAKPKAPVLSIQ